MPQPPDHDVNSASLELQPNSSLPSPKTRGAGLNNAIMPFEASTVSDSGTEADGEYFLRGLPAPKARLHKGLRGEEEPLSGVSTPLLPPPAQRTWKPECMIEDSNVQSMKKKKRRSRILVRRAAELGVVVVLTGVVIANEDVAAMIKPLTRELAQFGALYTLMLCVYPLRVIMLRTSPYSKPTLGLSSITIPPDFDPAPFLYPPVLTLLASFLISSDKSQLLAPNIVLAISTIPRYLVPFACYSTPDSSPSSVHWLLSLLPLLTSTTSASKLTIDQLSTYKSLEILSYLYPLHQYFCVVLYSLTTTSLLPAELELLSVALINILLFAESPQIKILRALIWVGGFLVLLSTGNTILKGIALARVPKWRFRRDRRRIRESPIVRPLRLLWNPFCLKRELLGLGSSKNSITAATEETSDSLSGNDYNDDSQEATQSSNKTRVLAKPRKKPERSSENRPQVIFTKRRRRTLSVSLKPLLKLTPEQAMARKWLYAGYVYTCIVTIIIFPVRLAISRDALNGHEAIGWAMGYLFGDVGYFRWQVVSYKLNDWIILPPRVESLNKAVCCGSGWVQNIRLSFVGVANTRLLLAAYWLLILVIGLLVVFRLSAIYEVDTRRKVFHFMMVAMMLPSIFVDACFCAMALSFALAIFLLLDLLRASQLPPLSKPIATFLAPYVDGRDFKGPVVVSHIFLLIGCAIPLWLSLAAQSRAVSDVQGWPQGWELPARHVSMVAGVVCVGLGDAAASLVGRRYGRHKWYWGGGKSLEGSIAFALAVCAGLMAASAWMRIGGWPVAQEVGVSRALGNSLGCGSLASLTEAVLTGGNDNVIVPVVLWMCVKSIGV
ncbi:Dolichol kinase sec59 [Ceratocystis lukuohia]|uniref:dolichol kinase n=1 Tax=Ceratocystis lukuohia TaxID=2019550 RepID=A0ABR4MHX5_9PEZI